MKINNLLENITPTSNPDQGQGSQAPHFGRSDKFLEQKVDETTAGAIASVATPVGKVQRRGKGSMFAGIKTSAKFPNSVKEGVNPQNFDSDEDYYDAVEDSLNPYSGMSSDELADELARLKAYIRREKSETLRRYYADQIDKLENILYPDDENLEEADEWEEDTDKRERFLKYAKQKLLAAASGGGRTLIQMANQLSVQDNKYFGSEYVNTTANLSGITVNMGEEFTQAIANIMSWIRSSQGQAEIEATKAALWLQPEGKEFINRVHDDLVGMKDHTQEQRQKHAIALSGYQIQHLGGKARGSFKGDAGSDPKDMMTQEVAVIYDMAELAIAKIKNIELYERIRARDKAVWDALPMPMKVAMAAAAGTTPSGMEAALFGETEAEQMAGYFQGKQEYDSQAEPEAKVAEAKKANTKTARKEFGARVKKPTLSDKEQEKKKSDSDKLWAMLQAHIAAAEKDKEVKEGQKWPDTSNSLAKRKPVAAFNNVGVKAGRPGGMTVSTRVEPTITSTSVKRLGGDRPIPSSIKKEANSFLKPGPATTGKFPEPRKPSFSGDQGSKSETLGRDGLIYHWQDPRAKQGVAEGHEVDASVVIGKLYDIIDHAEDAIKNADYDRQVQYVTVVRDRAVKALNMIKTNPAAAEAAWKYFQNGEQVNEKSKSQAQFRTMAAVANNPKFAKKVGISQKVGKEFHSADKKQDYKDLPKEVDEDLSRRGFLKGLGAAAVAGAAGMIPTGAKAEYSSYSLQSGDGQWLVGAMALIYFGMYGKVRNRGYVAMAQSVLNDLKKVAAPVLDFIDNVYIMDTFEKMRDSKPDQYKMYLQASQDSDMPITILNKVLRIKDNFIRGMSPELQRQYANELGHTIGMRESVSQGVAEEKQRLDPKCWKGYKKQGTKMKGDTRVNNCVPIEETELNETDMLAKELFKQLELFKKGADKDIGSKAKDRDISNKAKDKDIVTKEASGEYDDEAGSSESNLLTTARAVKGLIDTIDDRDNLPEWVQEKIAKAEGMLVASWDYLQSQKEQGIDPQVDEDWQKANKSDKTDGMSPKAVKAYRRENPGSKLKTAVTKKPSELKAGSKDAKRRKSFCARMSGNKGPMKDEKGRPTPKAKALKRWNC